MYVNVLDRNLLLTLASMAIKCVDQGCKGAAQLIGLGEILAASLEEFQALIPVR